MNANKNIKEYLIILFVCAAFLIAIGALAQETLTPTANGVVLCNASPVAGADIDMSGCTSAMMIPSGNTAQRPATPLGGMVRWNSDFPALEFYNGTGWVQFLSPVYNNAPSHPIQTVAASANGFQLSATRDAEVSYSVLITVTASIASGQSGYVVLEICPTNSAVAANWIEVARASSSQVYTLAIALQGVQGAGSSMFIRIPAGYYARLRSVNVTGTPAYSFVSGQEVQL